MNVSLTSEVSRLGGDPSDSVWEWFLLNGPHGGHFTWGPTRKTKARYIGLVHLKEVVADLSQRDPAFLGRATEVAVRALGSHMSEVIRRGIQILAVIGDKELIDKIVPLVRHSDAQVAADAKACVFELKRKDTPEVAT